MSTRDTDVPVGIQLMERLWMKIQNLFFLKPRKRMRPSREKEDKQRKGDMIKSWNIPHIQSLRQESGVSRLDGELMKMEVKENQERRIL